MSLNNYTSLETYPDFVRNAAEFGAFVSFEKGMEPYTGNALMGLVYYPIYVDHVDPMAKNNELCTMMHYEQTNDFSNCVMNGK